MHLPMRLHPVAGAARISRRVTCRAAVPGKCWIVGAGPGTVEYLTVKAMRLLGTADVVVYDDLVGEDVLGLIPTSTKVYVGKRGGQVSTPQSEINRVLVEHCVQGREVVRLKGGCPSVFSRVHSEMDALAAAQVPFELVPGISSALAAPLLQGIPLTCKGVSSSFTVLSGHDIEEHDWEALARLPTLVVLMGGSQLPTIVARLIQHGKDASTPVCIVRAAGSSQQEAWHATLDQIVGAVAGKKLSPCVVLVGHVAQTAASGTQDG